MLDSPGGREGYLRVNVTVPGALLPIILARSRGDPACGADVAAFHCHFDG